MASFAPTTTRRAAVFVTAALVFSVAGSLSAHKTVVSPFTYYRDVRPLFERSCASCHDQASVAPLLLRYDAAVAAYPAIERALLVSSRPEHGSRFTHVEFDRVMTWTAGGTPEGDRPPGAPLPAPKRHAPHAGQLGGLMVPIAGDSLHAEAVFSEQRRLRLFITTVTGQAVSVDQLRALQMAVKTADESVTPFTLSKTEDVLEARIQTVTLPATFILVDRSGATSSTLSVQFGSYSIDPPDLSVPPTAIPSTDADRIAAIQDYAAIALQQAASSQLGQLYQPTTHVRDVLVAMTTTNVDRERALREMIRATWALHLAGDNGFRSDVIEAASSFEAALRALTSAYAQ